jgi:hypothetical protein
LTPGDVVIVSLDGVTRVTFSVGDSADTTRPPKPDAEFDGPYSNGRCPAYASIRADLDSDTIGLIAAKGRAPALDGEASLAGLGIENAVVVAGPDATTATIAVAAFDRAGNVSEPVDVEVTFPDTRAGCGAGQTAPGLILPLFFLRRRRKQRRHGTKA